jgi:putative phage-type endonuclease
MGGSSQPARDIIARGSSGEMARVKTAVEAFAPRCEWTGTSANGRDEWLLARRKGVGGSDVAAILGVGRYASALSVYAEKTAHGPPDAESSEVARWGQLFEPLILKEYARRTKRRVVRGGLLLRSREAVHRLVTLDGAILSKPPEWAGKRAGPGILEIKTGLDARYGDGGEDDDDMPELPVEVQIQIQYQLAVTGASWAACAWLPFPSRRMAWLDIAPHPEFQAVLLEKVDAFWLRVLRREPPDADGSEATKQALNALYPQDDGTAIRIADASAFADEWERNKAAIKLLTARQALIRNTLAATIRDAKYALVGDGRHWRTATIAGHEKHCPGCNAVVSRSKGYRSYTLADIPKKKRLPEPVELRALPAAFQASLAALDGAPANDDGGELAAAIAQSIAELTPANDGAGAAE